MELFRLHLGMIAVSRQIRPQNNVSSAPVELDHGAVNADWHCDANSTVGFIVGCGRIIGGKCEQ